MAKNPHAVALGRKGGRIGGQSTSPKKRAAVRKNLAIARAVKAAQRLEKAAK